MSPAAAEVVVTEVAVHERLVRWFALLEVQQSWCPAGGGCKQGDKEEVVEKTSERQILERTGEVTDEDQ